MLAQAGKSSFVTLVGEHMYTFYKIVGFPTTVVGV
jgi:hypothetical protein